MQSGAKSRVGRVLPPGTALNREARAGCGWETRRCLEQPFQQNTLVGCPGARSARVGGIDRCLVMVSAGRSDQAELVCGIFVEDKRSKGAQASGLVADRLWNRSFQTKVGAVSDKTAVVGEALGVVAETDLIVGVVEAAETGDDFGLAVTLEPGARNDVEDAESAVAVLGGVAAALDFNTVDVLGVELRADVGGNAGVGDRHAVEQPRNLMTSANVELVVDNECAGHVIGNHRHAIGVGGARGVSDLAAANYAGGGGGLGVDGLSCVL